MRLLVTRPEPDATCSADALRARGHDVLVSPVLAMQAIEADIGGPYAVVLMTSANAARATAGLRFAALHRLPALAVGDRTAEAARASGFVQVDSAGGALPDLLRMIAARGASGRLLYLAGEDRAGDLGAALAAHGMNADTVAIYRVVPAAKLPADIAQALPAGRLDGVLHYSPRSAATVLRLAREAGVLPALAGLTHYCLSDAVAAPLREAGAKLIPVAPHPDEAALFGLI